MLRVSFNDLISPDNCELDGADRRLFGDYSRLVAKVIAGRLTKTQKCYIMLYYKDGLTMEEIAQRFGVCRSTVSRTIGRARNNIAEAIAAEILKKALRKRSQRERESCKDEQNTDN